MRFTIIAFIASLVGLIAAQTPNLPACVASCYASSLAADPSCTSTDLACLCKSTAFSAAVSSCFTTSCTSAADQAAGIAFAYQSCLAVGITIVTSALPAATSGAARNSTSVAASTRPASASSVPASITPSATPSPAVVPSATTSTRSTASCLQLQGALGLVALVAAFVL